MRSWILLFSLLIVAAAWLVPDLNGQLSRFGELVLSDLSQALPPPFADWVWTVPPWFWVTIVATSATVVLLYLDRPRRV